MIAGSENTSKSSPAPLSTKNSTISGPVQRSTRSISSAENGHRLQNTVPNAMHTSREEKPTVTAPIRKVSCERATAKRTYVTEMLMRLLRE